MAGVNMVVIPFKGGGPAVLAVISGECQFTFATALSVLGSDIIGGEPKQLTEYMRIEIPRWAKVIKESGARAD